MSSIRDCGISSLLLVIILSSIWDCTTSLHLHKSGLSSSHTYPSLGPHFPHAMYSPYCIPSHQLVAVQSLISSFMSIRFAIVSSVEITSCPPITLPTTGSKMSLTTSEMWRFIPLFPPATCLVGGIPPLSSDHPL